MVRLRSANVATGNPADAPIEFLGAGDENSIGFTLQFDPTLLQVQQVTNGTGATNVTLNVNTNPVASGRLGIAIAKSTGQTFALGTQQVAVIRFVATANPGVASMTFADAPVVREVVSANADSLNTIFLGDTITSALLSPTITQHPIPRQVGSGEIVGFRVVAVGSLPMTYQWNKDGAALPGATNALFLLSSAQVSDSGGYAATVQNAGGTAYSSNALLTVIAPDTNGPVLTFARYGVAPLADGLIVSNTDVLTVNASDPSGVSLVEFFVDGNLLASDSNPSDGFSTLWNLERTTDGPHDVVIKATDSRNNTSFLTNRIVVALATPSAVVIGFPASGTVVGDFLISVRGTGTENTSINLYRNGARIGAPAQVPLNRIFQTTLALVEGTNRIQAAAFNRAGEGPRSAEVIVILDSSLPQPPNGLQASAKDGGRVELRWQAPDKQVKGYRVYRSTSSISDVAPKLRITGAPISQTSLLDGPLFGARYFYRVTSVNLADVEGLPGSEASVTSDGTQPVAISIQFSTLGAYNPDSGVFGKGIMTATVIMSEALQAIPFLSVVPSNGLPITVDLTASPNNTYVGSFVVGASTPSGRASVVFSARDLVGNRGSGIRSGASLILDTAGPEVSKLAFSVASPISNNATNPALVEFTAVLTEPIGSNAIPQFTYNLSQTSQADIPVAALSPGSNALTWIGSFRLPTTAGSPPETLTLNFSGADALGNVGTSIHPSHQLDVYQGALPALEPPTGLSAKSKPAGAIELKWQAVPNAADYMIYRKAALESTFVLLKSSHDATTLDTPSADGLYDYAVGSVRRQNGQESISAYSNIAEGKSDRVAPGAPTNVTIQLAANGAFLKWTPSASAEPVTYNLYCANRTITNLDGAVPVIQRIPIGQVVYPGTAPWLPYYAVAAVDIAGNVSLPSETVFLNSELQPVRAMTVTQTDDNPPVLAWTQVGNTIVGHNLFLGEDGAWVKMNPGRLITSGQFWDTGWSGDERRYTLVSVDRNQQQSIGRSLRFPRVSFAVDTNAVVKRGLMNRLTCVVQSASSNSIENAQVLIGLGGRFIGRTCLIWPPGRQPTSM